jgi:hypothetical protein
LLTRFTLLSNFTQQNDKSPTPPASSPQTYTKDSTGMPIAPITLAAFNHTIFEQDDSIQSKDTGQKITLL